MPSGTAVTSSGPISASPCRKWADGIGGCSPNLPNASATAAGSITGWIPVNVAIHASTVPTSTAASPPGMPNGNRTRAIQLTRMIANEMNDSHGTCQLWNAGRIEMNAIEIPANAPSIAARGVYLRTVGPTNAPSKIMQPMTNAQAQPASHASTGSF